MGAPGFELRPGKPQHWIGVSSLRPASCFHSFSPPPPQQHFQSELRRSNTRVQFVAHRATLAHQPGHEKAERSCATNLAATTQLEEDCVHRSTPIGRWRCVNCHQCAFPAKRNGVIVLAHTMEDNYPLAPSNYVVAANERRVNYRLLMAIADRLRAETAGGKKLDGYSVWLLFDDGEEAIQCL